MLLFFYHFTSFSNLELRANIWVLYIFSCVCFFSLLFFSIRRSYLTFSSYLLATLRQTLRGWPWDRNEIHFCYYYFFRRFFLCCLILFDLALMFNRKIYVFSSKNIYIARRIEFFCLRETWSFGDILFATI